MKSTSPGSLNQTKTVRYSRDLPVRWEVDVAVIGGGFAGVCAACAAAESGASVVLVERFATAGGVMTNGGVNNFSGETGGQGRVFDEITARLEAFGAIAPYVPWTPFGPERGFDHEVLKSVLQEVLLSRGVRLLLHCRFVDVAVAASGRLDTLVLSGASGPEGLRAKQFIDCTGEAELAFLAGCETLKGRPGDGLQLPMSFMYFVREVDEADRACQVPEDGQPRIASEADLPMTTVWPNGPRSKAIKIKIVGHDSTDTESLTRAEIAGRRRMLQVLDFHQRQQGKPWRLSYPSPVIGIREGRRVAGDYVLAEADVRAGRAFDDGVAVGTYYLDAHEPSTDKRVNVIQDPEKRRVPPYHIPLRCLVARDADNLWMAGRNVSSDFFALSSARVAPTCAMMGQAAGVAAALAARRGLSAHAAPADEVRRILVDRGARLELRKES